MSNKNTTPTEKTESNDLISSAPWNKPTIKERARTFVQKHNVVPAVKGFAVGVATTAAVAGVVIYGIVTNQDWDSPSEDED